ncbi:uncharacterized protein LOC131939354 [Physella acuta]|uniref:uncharacterized protein LOC131939354 n=1 Tax=Physella acuta TaxID=109671 RepID=UPI0027DDF4B6|nr:uncharacterized protein LOC131939354 [Physella acuta]XP_059153618.1 uncharacterized protein LOC131939354 [Physella acuta]
MRRPLQAAVFVCSLFQLSLAWVRLTNGQSGSTCELGYRKCIARFSECQDGECVCKSGLRGRGDFFCFQPAFYNAEVLNDPNLWNFKAEYSAVPAPCRYLLTHFRSNYTKWPFGQCEVKVHAYNAKHRGTVYVHGFDLALRIVTSHAVLTGTEISFRKFGHATASGYTFEELGSLSYAPDGPWNVTDTACYSIFPGSSLRVRHDPYNNYAYFEVEACGVKVVFRPFNLEEGVSQSQLPGLGVMVSTEHDVTWLSSSDVIALDPASDVTLSSLASSLNLTRQQVMLYRMLASNVQQNQPNAAPSCEAASNAVTSCTSPVRRRLAFDLCEFMVRDKKVINCLDQSENGGGVMDLFARCVTAVCTSSVTLCQEVKASVATCSGRMEVAPPLLQPGACP